MAHHQVIIETREVRPGEWGASVSEGPDWAKSAGTAVGYITRQDAFAASRRYIATRAPRQHKLDFLHANL